MKGALRNLFCVPLVVAWLVPLHAQSDRRATNEAGATGSLLDKGRGHIAKRRSVVERATGVQPIARSLAADKRVSLFDGKTFAGWEGNMKSFRIEDKAIVGGSLKESIPRNEFLCTKKEYGNFELRLKFKLVGKDANAGVQFRSKRIPNDHEVIGYQADLGKGYWGCLYDESRRRRVLARPDAEKLGKVLKQNDWNEYVIRAQGKHIQLWINGYKTVDYTEKETGIEQRGVIGLQIHGGPPSEAWYKDIAIREL